MVAAEELLALAGGVEPAVDGGDVRKTAGAQELLTLRSVVVSGHKGREVEVDTNPRCQHCGRRVGDYFGLPWSVRCPECRKQASSQ